MMMFSEVNIVKKAIRWSHSSPNMCSLSNNFPIFFSFLHQIERLLCHRMCKAIRWSHSSPNMYLLSNNSNIFLFPPSNWTTLLCHWMCKAIRWSHSSPNMYLLSNNFQYFSLSFIKLNDFFVSLDVQTGHATIF